MENELIARYIYAVTRRLPNKMRADIKKELETIISDMLEERCGEKPAGATDVRFVLTELGKPEDLAARYSGDENKALISGEYFLLYKRLLRLILPLVAASTALANVMLLFLSWDAPAGPDVFDVLGSLANTLSAVLYCFAVMTLVFAIMEKKRVKLDDGDMFANLPPVPQKNARIKPYEPVLGMVMHVAAALLFVCFSYVIGVWADGQGWLPLLAPNAVQELWPLFALWAAVGIAREAVKLVEGRYTKRLLVATACANAIILLITAAIWLNARLMNPAFVEFSGGLFSVDGGFIETLFANFNRFMMAIITLALVLDTLKAAYSYRRFEKPGAAI